MAIIGRLGDLCKMYQPKTISSDMLIADGPYPVFGANGIIGRYDQYNHENPELLMTCRGATCGTINVSLPFSWINGNAMVIHPLDNRIIFDYLKYHLQAIDLTTVITGAAQPQITRQSLVNVPIKVPSVEEQQEIVSELDLLSGIIERKNKQIEDLELLTKSLFFEMFGDPVANDKSWDVKSLKDICSRLYAGGDVPKGRFSKEKSLSYTVPILSNGKGASALYGYTDIPRESSPAITISGRGTIGYSTVQLKPFYPIIRLIVAVPLPMVNILYLQKHLSLMTFESTGGAIPQLTIPMVKDRQIIIPPLSLQEEFAKKIESVEKQVNSISQSLSDTETLLQSRMDYWFN